MSLDLHSGSGLDLCLGLEGWCRVCGDVAAVSRGKGNEVICPNCGLEAIADSKAHLILRGISPDALVQPYEFCARGYLEEKDDT